MRMTETEKLHVLLKKNGIDFEAINDETTMWTHDDGRCDGDDEYVAWEDDGRLYVEQPVKVMDVRQAIEATIGPNGETSDGYHTFNELYEHRTGLLMALCNVLYELMRVNGYSDEAIAKQGVFKSRLHDDGTMYDDMFIAGINCADIGALWATWHCEGEWWDLFDIPEVDFATKWDGHTPADALERLVDAFNPTDWSDSGD